MYRIDVDASRSLIRVTLGGMMSVAETAEYIAELRARFLRDRLRAGYLLLLDVTECTIQSQDMIGAMRDHMAAFPKASRIAIITGSSLARMQIRRLMTQSYAEVFDSADVGESWLLAGSVPPVAEARAFA